MDMEIEESLRRALRAEEPRADFTSRVLTQVSAPKAGTPRLRRWRLPAALAAALVLATIGLGIVQQQREAQRLNSARDLAMALEITSSQLNQVQRMLNRRTTTEDGI
jgi:hypothetical protein